MKTYMYRSIYIFALTASFVPGVTLSEVTEKQINSENTIVHVNNESWQPEGFVNGIEIPASYVNAFGITIDGKENEVQWTHAVEVTVPLDYGIVQSALLKAVYTDDEVFIRVRWKDSTEDRNHHPWVWDNDQEQYMIGPQVEDSLLLSFEAGCEWFPSLLAGYTYDFDGWQWMAARSDPLGQAADLAGTVQDQDYPRVNKLKFLSRNKTNIWNLKFTDKAAEKFHANWDELERAYLLQPVNKSVYLYIQTDGSRDKQEFAKQLPAPEMAPLNGDEIFPRYQPLKLQGQSGEVAAKGHWENGYWTVEFRRARVTPARTANDTIFNRLTQFSVYVFDSVEQIDQASESGRLFLRFMEKEQLGEDVLIVRD